MAYSLTDDAGGRFGIDSATSVATVADGALLNAAGDPYTITVRVTDPGELWAETTFAIEVTSAGPPAATELLA